VVRGIYLWVTVKDNSIRDEEIRDQILEGIAKDQKNSDIAEDLGVSRWRVKKEIRKMSYMEVPGLKEAKEAGRKAREERQERLDAEKKHVKQNERFIELTGMTLKEKSFRNMIEFYKPELRKVLNSSDQNSIINSFSKTVRKTMKKNNIITDTWQTHELTPKAIEYLENNE
jgi:DNA-directed RNA polymerase specialized sigma subunit